MNMMNDNEIKKKADYFIRNFLPVHITKKNKEWYNGYIINLQDDFLMIDEYKKGALTVFLSDIIDIEQFEPPIVRGMKDGKE